EEPAVNVLHVLQPATGHALNVVSALEARRFDIAFLAGFALHRQTGFVLSLAGHHDHRIRLDDIEGVAGDLEILGTCRALQLSKGGAQTVDAEWSLEGTDQRPLRLA